ncbi:hypothetical protein F5Y12DRAFT_718561 [Xylaria sp. FL1777]|nr:hypothetical protein F5Y12DRAFT_718561 [Xylaria sp. FL1777]
MASVASTQAVGALEVVNFLKLLSALATDQSTAWMDRVLKDNEDMKAIVQQKESDNKTFVRTIANLKNELDEQVKRSDDAAAQSADAKTKASELVTEIDGAKKTIAEKDQKLKEDATTIAGLKGNVEALHEEAKKRNDVIEEQKELHVKDSASINKLQGQLVAAETALKTTSNQLKELQDLSCNVVDGTKEFVITEIDKIYGHAKEVAIRYFNEDLPDDILADTHLFEGIRKLVKLPLPASNSGPAKRVRVAAFLASLGSQLADQIFVPFYLLPDENQDLPIGIDTITVMLSNLTHTDPRRELHLRSVLLAISPEEQRRVAYERADEIADDIFENLRHLVTTEQQSSFGNDIFRLCRLAVQIWDTLRSLKAKVEPFTETEEDTEKFWLPAELDSTSQTKKSQANGKPNGLGSKPSLHSLKSARGIKLVWPGFSYGNEVLKQGFMLLESQVERANEEVPLKRNVRAMQRAATASPVLSQRRSVAKKTKLLKAAD